MDQYDLKLRYRAHAPVIAWAGFSEGHVRKTSLYINLDQKLLFVSHTRPPHPMSMENHRLALAQRLGDFI